MSQHDFNIANQGFPAFRSDLNNALTALASNSSGATPPSTTYANQFWYETDTNTLYFRNEDNDAWITLAVFDQTNDEWEVRTGVIQAVDSAGISLKTDEGTTRFSISDGGQVSFQNYSFPTADGSANESLVTNGSGALSFGHPDKISEGNSSVEVVDTGTGSIQFDVDGSEVARLNSTGLGVGTIAPSSRLEVAGDASPIVTIKSTSGPYSDILSNTVGSLLLRADQGDTGASTNCSIYVDGDLEFRATPGFISFNSGYGSVATAYGCRAWVNFNGTGTVSIREDGNVSSITDDGTGLYTINLSTSMPDTNVVVVASGDDSSTVRTSNYVLTSIQASSTSAIEVTGSSIGGTERDLDICMVAVFR